MTAHGSSILTIELDNNKNTYDLAGVFFGAPNVPV